MTTKDQKELHKKLIRDEEEDDSDSEEEERRRKEKKKARKQRDRSPEGLEAPPKPFPKTETIPICGIFKIK